MVKLPEGAVEDAILGRQLNRDMLEELWTYYILVELGPSRLLELEQIAELVASTDPNPNNKQKHMNKMRQLYKLEFKLRCDECGTAHVQDEITAPER